MARRLPVISSLSSSSSSSPSPSPPPSPPPHSYIALIKKGKYDRGSLMKLKKNGDFREHSHWTSKPTAGIELNDDEVGPLTEKQCKLLDAIEEASNRYELYKSERLLWGLKLKKGDLVLAKLPSSGSSHVPSIVRWAGMTDCGHRFGVEIVVRVACIASSLCVFGSATSFVFHLKRHDIIKICINVE